jgi:hypothetical protein
LEKFYKNLRTDLGLNDIENPDVLKSQADKAEKDSGEDGEVMDNRKLNDLIKNAMTSDKEEKKGRKKKK